MAIIDVLHSKKCSGNKNDKKCAKALKQYFSHSNIFINHSFNNLHQKAVKTSHKKHKEKTKVNVPPPPATAQGERDIIPNFTLFAERQHFVNLMREMKQTTLSPFSNIYNGRERRESSFNKADENPESDEGPARPADNGRASGEEEEKE